VDRDAEDECQRIECSSGRGEADGLRNRLWKGPRAGGKRTCQRTLSAPPREWSGPARHPPDV